MTFMGVSVVCRKWKKWMDFTYKIKSKSSKMVLANKDANNFISYSISWLSWREYVYCQFFGLQKVWASNPPPPPNTMYKAMEIKVVRVHWSWHIFES